MVWVSGATEPEGRRTRRAVGSVCVRAPLGGAVGIAIKEHFPERFVWSEGLMENRRMLKTPIYGHVFNFR